MFDWFRRLIQWLRRKIRGHKTKVHVWDEAGAYLLPQKPIKLAARRTTKARPRTSKHLKIEEIRRKNIARQRSTLGHGLRGKFKPRPAFEKRNWRLDKKPEDED